MISSGPTNQYRSIQNFYLWTKKVTHFRFQRSTWNLLETSHDKGAADGIGVSVKRRVDSYLKHIDITIAKEMYDLLADDSKVKIFLVGPDYVTNVENEVSQNLLCFKYNVNKYFLFFYNVIINAFESS